MRLNRRALAAKLDVSERALLDWQRAGMPVLEHGRRGQGNVYDLAAVVRWIRATGRGLTPKANRRPIDLGALEAELGLRPAPAVVPIDWASLARAVAVARLDFIEDCINEYSEIPPRVLAELAGLFVCGLIFALKEEGFAEACAAIDAILSEDAWPEDAAAILARARAEIPSVQTFVRK